MFAPHEIEIDQRTCSLVTASLLWHQILAEYFPPAVGTVDVRLCLDVLSRCEEQMIIADPGQVTLFVASLLAELDPGPDFAYQVREASRLICALSED